MIKSVAGAVLASLFPQKAVQVEQGFTMPYFGVEPDSGIIGRLIRAHIAQNGSRDQQKLEDLHKNFWRGQSPGGWFGSTSQRLHTVYVPTFGPLVEIVHAELIENQIENVVEFGTGNGDWLAWLKSTWSFPNKFLGIDLAADQIRENHHRHADLDFEASDLTEWVSANESRRTLFLTHCGVLEYLSESTLKKLFQAIRSRHRESMVLFVEPISPDFDLETEQDSRLHGNEFSFSHNYPSLLSQADFKIIFSAEHEVEGHRMLCILGKAGT